MPPFVFVPYSFDRGEQVGMNRIPVSTGDISDRRRSVMVAAVVPQFMTPPCRSCGCYTPIAETAGPPGSAIAA